MWSLVLLCLTPDFDVGPECKLSSLASQYLASVDNMLYTDVFSDKVLVDLITIYQTKLSRPLLVVLDLYSTSFHIPETALFCASVRSYSTMFLHVFLLGNSPGRNTSSSIIKPKMLQSPGYPSVLLRLRLQILFL